MPEFTHTNMRLCYTCSQKQKSLINTRRAPVSCRKRWQPLVNRGSAVSPSASLTTHAHSSLGSTPDANTHIMLVYPSMCEIHTFAQPFCIPPWLKGGLAPPVQMCVCVFSCRGEDESVSFAL